MSVPVNDPEVSALWVVVNVSVSSSYMTCQPFLMSFWSARPVRSSGYLMASLKE